MPSNLTRAAIAWWRSRKPLYFTAAEHLENPYINMQSDAERRLAKAVAAEIRKGKRHGK